MNSDCRTYEAKLLALLDGALDDASARRVREHVASCDSCREELDWLETVSRNLERLGEYKSAQIAQVDLVAAVITAASEQERREQDARPTVAPFSETGRRTLTRVSARWWFAAAAAVAVLLYATGLLGGLLPNVFVPGRHGGPTPVIRRHVASVPGDEASPPLTPDTDTMERTPAPRIDIAQGPSMEEAPQKPAQDPRSDAPRETSEESEPSFNLAMLRANADRVGQRARDILASVEDWLGAEVGAARFLPPSEAEPVLLAAIEKRPDDSYLRYQLAKVYMSMPEAGPEVHEQLDHIERLDPDNALLYYLGANQYLREGDVESALAELGRAEQLPKADPYSSEALRHYAEALEASGLSAPEAQVTAALTDGASETDTLQELANQLLESGIQIEGEDPAAARSIYEAVYRLGDQLSNGAQYFDETLAAAYIQEMTLGLLEGVYSAQGLQREVEQMAHEAVLLVESVEALSQSYSEFYDSLLRNPDPERLMSISLDILQNGDLPFLRRPRLRSPTTP